MGHFYRTSLDGRQDYYYIWLEIILKLVGKGFFGRRDLLEATAAQIKVLGIIS